MPMKKIDRRSFLKTSLLTAGSLGAMGAFSRMAKPSRPSLRPFIPTRGCSAQTTIFASAVIGFNGGGQDHHLSGHERSQAPRVVALCDVDDAGFGPGGQTLPRPGRMRWPNAETSASCWKTMTLTPSRLRRPTHWHAFLARYGPSKQGKDVYVEKPISHNVWEEATACECGAQTQPHCPNRHPITFQHRVDRSDAMAARWKPWKNQGRPWSMLQAAAQHWQNQWTAIPLRASVDYDVWTGPAPMEPLRRARNCIMTGIGSGRRGTATWETRAFTKWMWPAGPWGLKPGALAANLQRRRLAGIRG